MTKAVSKKTPGRFIVIEGIDGAGTTTQSKRLVSALKARSLPALFTCEPTGGPVGAMIRQALSGRLVRPVSETEWTMLDPNTMTLLFSADRLDHAEGVIRPALAEGRWVICDRYYLSTLAYQGVGGDADWIRQVNAKAPKPDLWIFLSVPPKKALSRLGDRETRELYEKEAFLKKVHRGYLRELDKEDVPVLHLDGTKTEDEVFSAIWSALTERFGL